MEFRPFEIEEYYDDFGDAAEIDMSSSECEPLSVREVLELTGTNPNELLSLPLGYTSTNGAPSLRAALARADAWANPDDYLVFNSSGEAMYAAFAGILSAGDHVIAHVPSYQSLHENAAALGCRVSPWVARYDEAWALDLDELERLIRKETKLIVINSPHNPTGFVFEADALKRLVGIAEKHGLIVLADELFLGLELDSELRHQPLFQSSRSVVSLAGLAKSAGAPGLRIGWIASQDDATRARIINVKRYLSRCVAAPSEMLAERIVSVRSELQARNRQIACRNRDTLNHFFKLFDDRFAWIEPKAGNTGFPKLRHALDTHSFCTQVRNEAGVMLVPGETFMHGAGCFRIGFGKTQMAEGIRRLRSWLEAPSATRSTHRVKA